MQKINKDFSCNFEINHVVSQNVIPSKSYFGGAKPFAFTEQGVAMLSGILKSDRAIDVNIAIMRTFIQMRRMISNYKSQQVKIVILRRERSERRRNCINFLRHR